MKRAVCFIGCLILFLICCSSESGSKIVKKQAQSKQTTYTHPKNRYTLIHMKKFNPQNIKLRIYQMSDEVEKDIKINAPLISQMPELPRGCEVTSLAMLLQYAGKKVDKMTLAKEIKRDPTHFTKKNGQVFFGNPNTGFVGDMYSLKKPGFGVFHGPIFKLAKKYLPEAVDLTGQGWKAVEGYIKKRHPVWVICTSWFDEVPKSEWETWETPTGPVRITMHEHSVLITGFDDKYVYFNDPLADIKNRKVKKDNFIAGWTQFGMQAISY